jgi:hypothetical protein
MRSALLVAALALFSPAIAAGDHIVDYDRTVDFSGVMTFAVRAARVGIDRPEISNPLVKDRATDAIRKALVSRGLREVGEGADLLVDWTITGQGMFINEWGRAIPTNMGHNPGSWTPANRQGATTESFIEGMLVLDLTDRASGLLVWRGVYREKQKDAVRLAQRLPKYATTLLAEYPRSRR